MKILKSISGIAVLLCILLCGAAQSYGFDWALYYQDGQEKVFYDKGSVDTPRKGVVDVTVKATLFDAQEGSIRRLEILCHQHTYRVVSDKVDPVTGAFEPQLAAGGYRYTWFSYDTRMMALYQNLCE